MLAHNTETRTLILLQQRCSHCRGTLWLDDAEWKCSLCARTLHARPLPSAVAQPIAADSMGRFVKECCTSSPEASVLGSRLFEAYMGWCGSRQLPPVSRIAFARALSSLGYRRRRTRMARYWDGLNCRLAEEPLPAKLALSRLTS